MSSYDYGGYGGDGDGGYDGYGLDEDEAEVNDVVEVVQSGDGYGYEEGDYGNDFADDSIVDSLPVQEDTRGDGYGEQEHTEELSSSTGYDKDSSSDEETSPLAPARVSSPQPTTKAEPRNVSTDTEGKPRQIRQYLKQEKDSALKDWNAEFQEILGQMESPGKYQALHDLGHDFVHAAKTYGKIIISELNMPEKEKTIHSINAGGVAGGEKYICQSIFFKMVTDVLISPPGREPAAWLYGGPTRNDTAAMKGAGQDLQGLISFYNVAEYEDVHFPLMALIDYHGYRLIAISILPLDGSTLIYGSSDAGRSCHAKKPDFNQIMLNLGKRLNLLPHQVCDKIMAACGDIEGHLAHDGRYYMLDFARTFPPEAPLLPSTPESGRAIFYQHLRPEFVRSYAIPLSSDAFSMWGKNDPNRAEQNGRVRQATEYLYKTVIPSFAETFDHEARELLKHNNWSITEELHRHGINVRHCGRVRRCCRSRAARRILLTEMVARVLKEEMNVRLRKVMGESRIPLKIPYRQAVVHFLNEIIGWRATSREETEAKSTYWRRTAKAAVTRKFFMALRDEEMSRYSDLRDDIDPSMLFQRFGKLTAISFSPQMLREIEVASSLHEVQVIMNPSDIDAVGAKVKHLNVIDEAEAKMLSYEATRTTGLRGRQLWDKINRKFEAALSSNTSSYRTLIDWAASLLEESRLQINPKEALLTLKSASNKANTALMMAKSYVVGLYIQAQILLEEGARQAEGSPLQDRIFHSAIIAFIRILKLESRYYNEILGRARTLLQTAIAGGYLLPSQKKTSLLTSAMLYRALLSVSVADVDVILFEYAVAMYEYTVEASTQGTLSVHLELASLVSGQALHSYFLRTRKLSLSDNQATYTIILSQSDLAQNSFTVATCSKDEEDIAISKFNYGPIHDLSFWTYRCSLGGQEITDGDLFYQLSSLLSVMPILSSFPPEEVIGVFKYEPVDFFVLHEIISDQAGIDKANLPNYVEVFVIPHITSHPNLFQDVASPWREKLQPSATIRFGEGSKTCLKEPIQGCYLVLRMSPVQFNQKRCQLTISLGLVPQTGATQMTLKGFSFKGKHKIKILNQNSSMSSLMVELSRRKRRYTIYDSTKEQILPLKYSFFQTTFEKQGYYLATLLHMCFVNPFLRALTEAHINELSATPDQLAAPLRSSSSKWRPSEPKESRVEYQNNKEYGSVDISRCGSVTDGVVSALAHKGLLSLNLAYDHAITDKAIVSLGDNSGPSLRVVNLTGCIQLTSKSMEALARSCPNLLELHMWDTADFDSIQLLAKLKRLQKLSLAGCVINSNSVKKLCSECSCLEELDLTGADIVDADVKRLVRMPSLHTLTLDRCPRISSEGIQFLKDAVALSKISLNGTHSVSDDSLVRVVQERGQNITLLSLSDCGITNSLVTTIAHYCPNLLVLNLSGIALLDDSSLVYVAVNCRRLTRLDVSRNDLSSITLKAIAIRCTRLQELLMNDCRRIDNRALEQLYPLRSLNRLSLNHNHLVTQSSLLKLLAKMESIRELDVSDCPHFNEEGIIKAKSMRPNLRLTFSLIPTFQTHGQEDAHTQN